MVLFNELYIMYTALSCLVDILEELLFCHMFSYPETNIMNIGRREETDWHKLLKVLKTLTKK